MADHLSHQALDDYRSMNFEFPNENIMLVTDYKEPGPDEGLEEGSRWSMYFDGASNALGNSVWRCNHISRGLSYSVHGPIMFQLHQQHGRV